MANTYHQIYLQTVFAVKYRNAIISKDWRPKLLGVIGNLINEATCKTIIVRCRRSCALLHWFETNSFHL